MSIPQGPQQSSGEYPSSGYPTGGSAPGSYPPAGFPASGAGPTPYQPAAPKGTSGLAVAGLVFAFLFFPLGFLLSFIALFLTGKGGKKGRGLAVAGLLLSLALGVVCAVAFTVFIKDNVKNITTIADPGCIKGKQVILDSANVGTNTDPAVMKTELQTVVTGLDAAAAASKNADVKAAMTALSKDYGQLLTAIAKSTEPPADIETRTTADGNRIDELCTIGGAEK